jgi:protoheme IX farnesyltransferase
MRRTVAAPLLFQVRKAALTASASSAARWAGCPFSGNSATPSAVDQSSCSTASTGGGCPVMGTVPKTGCPVDEEPVLVPAPPTAKQIIDQLGKSRLSAFVTMTASAGYVLCGGTSVPAFVAVTAGTYLQSLAANTCNQCIEVENDRMMKRTMKRPLVVGAISRPQAVALAAAELAAGTTLLATACNPTVAALGVANWALYVFVYTPLKRVSTTNTWWGAIVGAIPPVMGGAAATGTTALGAIGPAYLLGSFVLVWQIPHFMSLAYHCRRDYEAAGFKMLPYSNPWRASMYAVTFSVVMAFLTMPGPALIGMDVEPWFYAASGVCNGGMVYKSVRFHMHPEKYCRSCFVFSYMYMAVMLAFFVGNHFQPMAAATHLWQHHVVGATASTSHAGAVVTVTSSSNASEVAASRATTGSA